MVDTATVGRDVEAIITASPSRQRGPHPGDGSPCADGKFLAVGRHRLWVRGVTYGTFGPDEEGNRFPDLARVYSDFAAMAAHGVNAVRVYTPPPRRVLDAAADVGLWVMVGLPWEQHIAFLTDRQRPAAITARVTDDVASCAGHPAVLCYAIGNEIPASVVRWHGRSRIERFIERLCRAVRSIDEEALLTYVNFPSTEYLAVPEADIIAFNVYLDDAERLAAYVSRLHNLADDRPLLLTELGMDSLRNGAVHQAEALARSDPDGFPRRLRGRMRVCLDR